MVVVANWRLDNAKGPAAMLQEKTARAPHTLCVASESAHYARSHAIRHTPGITIGYLFSSFDILAAAEQYVRKRKHSTSQQQQKNNENETEKIGKKCLIGTPCTGRKTRQKNEQSFSPSLVRRPPASRPPHLRFGAGKAFLTLCHSQPRRPPRVNPGAHRGRRSPAQ